MKRNTSLDIARGVAICLMVVGHCYSGDNPLLTTIYAFHMPFFFLVSGVLYSEKWGKGVTLNIIHTGMKLLIPYFVFEILFKIFLLILQRPANLFQQLADTFVNTILPFVGITVMWFLPCQLIVVLLSAFIIKLSKNKTLIGVGVFAILFLTGVIVRFDSAYATVPLRAFIGMGFFAVGYYGKPLIMRKANWWITLSASAVFVALALLNGMVTLVALDLANPFLYTLNGILGSYVLIQLALHCKENWISKKVVFLGKNTVIILATHMFVVEIIRLLDYKLFNNVLNRLGLFEGFVFGGIVIAVMCLVIPLCNRYFRFLFGLPRKKI